MSITLSNPYYLYPRWPCCTYLHYDKYNNELLRLYRFLNDQSKPVVTFVAIGAAWDEYLNSGTAGPSESDHPQFRQLFPWYFERMVLEKPDLKYQILIISPNPHFDMNSTKYVPPRFIEKTDKLFEWKSREDGSFFSPIYNIEVHVFFTMMPTVETAKRIKNSERIVANPDLYTKTNTQTAGDQIFIHKFYSTFHNFILRNNKHQYPVMIHSYAVFKQLSGISFYRMFKEIAVWESTFDPQLFLLAEWEYRDGVFVVCQRELGGNIIFWEPEERLRESGSDAIVPSWGESEYLIRFVPMACFLPDPMIGRLVKSRYCDSHPLLRASHYKITSPANITKLLPDPSDLIILSHYLEYDDYARSFQLADFFSIRFNVPIFMIDLVSKSLFVSRVKLDPDTVKDPTPLIICRCEQRLYWVEQATVMDVKINKKPMYYISDPIMLDMDPELGVEINPDSEAKMKRMDDMVLFDEYD